MSTAGGDLYAAVEAAFVQHDPLGLVSDDPDVEDEYGPEITTVLERLPRAHDEDDARRIIHAVLAEWFEGVDIGPEERYRELAAHVWSAWRVHAAGGR